MTGFGVSKESCMEQVERCLEQYRQEVEETELTPSTKRTYIVHATNFVRWMKHDFHPGAGRRPYPWDL